MKKLIVTTFILLIFVGSQLSAQGFRTAKKPKADYFLLDHAVFFSDSVKEKSRLEVYYQIFNPILTFEELDEYFEADYELTIRVKKGDRVVDSYTHKQTVRVESKGKAKSKYNYRTNQVNFQLKPDKYEIVATLYDLKSNKESDRKFKVKIEKRDNKKTYSFGY